MHTCSSQGSFFMILLYKNASPSNTCAKYGGAWPFYSGFIVVAWWRSLGRLLGPLGPNFDQNSKFKLVAAPGRLLWPLGPLLRPSRAHLVANSCSARAQLVTELLRNLCPTHVQLKSSLCPNRVQLMCISCPARVQLVPNSCPTRAQLVPNLCPTCAQRKTMRVRFLIHTYIVYKPNSRSPHQRAATRKQGGFKHRTNFKPP